MHQREIAPYAFVASEESGIDARIFEDRKQTPRQLRLWKSGKKVRKSLGRARWVVECTEIRTQAWHTLRTCRHIKLQGATLIEAHLVQNRHFVRRKVVAFRGKIADVLRDKDRRAIRGRQIPSRHMQPHRELCRRPQGHALPQEGLRIQAENGFHLREGDTTLEFLEAILRRGRFQSKIGVSCLRMAPCHLEASSDPGLQALPGQALLQVGEVTYKV